MGGVNPYIMPAKIKPPTKKYKVTFLPLQQVVEVDPAAGRLGHNGLPLSILDIAEGAGVDLDHSCGGVCACSTCHVYVREGLESCNEPNDDELDQLDNARGLEFPDSRLGCQCVPDGTQDVVVEIPAWNRNLVQE
jgi:ferredoxin, 2Fe-2S